MKKELTLHLQICEYLRLQYPKVIFTSDLSGLKVSIGTAIQMKKLRCSNGIPDLLIFEPNQKYKGLFIELKKDINELYTKKGIIRETEHITEQFNVLKKLLVKGYYAVFCCGFLQTKNTIDKYFKNEL